MSKFRLRLFLFSGEILKDIERLDAVFEKLDLLQVDESKRAEKIRDQNNLFGVEGSFKKLDID